MKQGAPARARATARAAKTPRKRTTPPPRAADTFERQADAAAARVLRPSERAAARDLTRAPAARAPIRTSPGAALPRAPRALLEQRFGADLAAVRVHTDDDAAAAAEAEGALAFAAGADVFFARGAFAPDMPSGLALLAHEVAHVLQQTGRTDAHGVLHASACEGDGALQLVSGQFPPSAARVALIDGVGDNSHLNVLIEEYEKHFSKNATLLLAIDWFVDQVNTHDGGVYRTGSTTATALANLVASIGKFVDGGSAAARSFVIEVLALTTGGPAEANWKAAATVLWRDETHDVVFRFLRSTDPFVTWLNRNRNQDYFARSLSHPRIQPWFDDLFRAYVEMLTDARVDKARPLMALDATTGDTLTLAEQRNAILVGTRTGLSFNPRGMGALNLLIEMDNDRGTFVGTWKKKIDEERAKRFTAGKGLAGFQIRAFVAGLVKEHFKAEHWTKRDKVWQEFAAKVEKLATNVEELVNRGLELTDKLEAVTKGSFRDLVGADAATRFAGGVARTAELDALEATLLTHAAKLFDKPTVAPPPPADYDALVTAFTDDLTAQQDTLQNALLNKLVVNPEATISTTHAWVLIWLHEAIAVFGKNPYELGKDLADKGLVKSATAPGGWADAQAEDLRRMHRHFLSAYLLRTALFAGMTGVATLATAMAIGDSKSRLLILEDWKEVDEPMSKMREDIDPSGSDSPIDWTSAAEYAAAAAVTPKPREAVSVKAPFTTFQLIEFFQLTYLQTINTEIEAVLDATYKNAIDNKTKYSLQPVAEAAKKMPRPRKAVPGKHRIILNPRDPKHYTVAGLYWESDKSRYQIRRHGLGAILVPRLPAIPEAPVYVWMIPDLTPMVTFLRKNVPLLDKMIADATGKAAPAAVDDWIYELGKIAGAALADREKIRLAISPVLGDDKVGHKHERKRLLTRSRELSALERQIVKAKAADLLTQWKNRPRGGMAGKIAYYKENALQMVREYRFHVEPWTDADAQWAALWLDLGPTLDDVFEKGEDIPPDILPPILMAIDAAKAQAKGRQPAKSSLLQPILIEDIVGRGGETTASIIAGQGALEKVRDRLIKHLEAAQEKRGFYSEGGSFKSYAYSSEFKVKGEFSWDNRQYRIKQIHRKFAYHPPLSGVPSVLKESTAKGAKDIPRDKAIPLFTIDIDDEAAPLGLPTPQTWALAGPSAEGIHEERAARRKLPPLAPTATEEEREERTLLEEKNKEDEQTEKETGRYVVTSADDKLLNVIGFAVELAAMNEGLQRTGEIIGGFMDVVVTAAEMILPGGQVILIAELIAGAIQAVTDPHMVELIELIAQDPKSVIDLITEKLKGLVSANTLWGILFDEGMEGLAVLGPFADIFDKARDKRQAQGKLPRSTTKERARPRGRLGRIVQFIVGLGKRFLRAFRMLKLKFKGPINRIRSAVVTRPRIAWILLKAISVLQKIDEIPHERIMDVAGISLDGFKEAATDTKGQVTEFAKHVSDMELPSELVPLDLLYGELLSFILGKIPKVKLIKPLLDAFGWTDKIAAEIIKYIGVKGSFADPNAHWQKHLIPVLEPHFLGLKKELVHSMVGLVNDVGAKVGFTITLPTDDELGPSAPNLVSAEELEQFASDEPGLTADITMPHDAGHPLDAGARTNAERHFGQDFGHVRVHDDATASMFTSSLGAEAATTGSHVYLGSGKASAAGGDVLHHELGHVIQQTGSRPLGGDHPETPVRGDTGPGLTFDAGREAAADHMAATGDVASTMASADTSLGLQPKLTADVLKKAVNSITRFRPGGGQFKAAAGGKDVPGAVRAKQVWKDLTALLGTKKAKFEKFLSDTAVVRPAVVDRCTVPVKNSDIESVAALAQKKVPGQTTPAGDPVTTLNPPFFITLLEGFLFAKTGVAMQIDASHDKGTSKVDGVKVNYVHLPFVAYASDAGKKLWDRLIGMKGLVTPADGSDGKTKVRHLLNAFLGARRPEPFLWDLTGTAFELSAAFLKEFRGMLDASRGRGRPGTVEIAKDYASTDLGTHPLQSGLRVALHGDISGGTAPVERKDRDSHHVPQFLLVEFFRNRHDKEKAWPEPPGGYAYDTEYAKKLGLAKSAHAGRLESVAPAGHSFRLGTHLDKNESQRGVGLPAVLLAMETHTNGKLHLDDLPDDGKPRDPQATVIKKKWWKELPPDLRNNDAAAWDAHLKAKPGDAARVKAAMVETYRWLYHDVMKDGLKDALIDIEKPYYEGLAAELGKVDKKDNLLDAYKLDTGLINKVMKAVEDKNSTVMSDWK